VSAPNEMAAGGVPTISIVTPSLDQAAYLADAVDSVTSQSHAALEHLVVDGASADGTVDYLRTRPEVDWTSEPDDGQSDALNQGFQRARGDIIGWLNADDRYRPGALATVARHFADHPRTDVLYGDINWIDRQGVAFEHRPSLDYDRFSLRYLHWLAIPSAATFFRSDIVHAGHVIDPSYRYAMDYEFFLRLANRGYRFDHVTATLADFRIHPDAKTGVASARQLAEHRQAAIAGNAALCRLPEPVRAPVWTALSAVARGRRVASRARAGHYHRSLRPGPRPAFLARPAPWARQSGEPARAGR
jgi:glycosyltransferase involved in cell wall biosynthesis